MRTLGAALRGGRCALPSGARFHRLLQLWRPGPYPPFQHDHVLRQVAVLGNWAEGMTAETERSIRDRMQREAMKSRCDLEQRQAEARQCD